MGNAARGEVFADFDSERAVWRRNAPSAGEMKPEWHIVGPKMPRLAPVSPSHISPCGRIIYSDGAQSRRDSAKPGPTCSVCERWLEAIDWK